MPAAKSPTKRPILTSRPMQMRPGPALPRYWVGGNPHYTLFLNLLSVGFPVGELTFIEALRRFQGQLQDPELVQQIRVFNAQEGAHAHQHRIFNTWIEEQFPGMRVLTAETERQVKSFEAQQTPRENLALTVGLEHLTAAVAACFLNRPELLAVMPAEIYRLWIWHAIEEIEHKAVAFDVYQAIGGGYGLRIKMYMLGLWRYFRRSVVVMTISLYQDRQLLNIKGWTKFLWMYAGPRGIVWPLTIATLRFFSPRFHPSNEDQQALLSHWQGVLDREMSRPGRS